MSRLGVALDVLEERQRQDAKWGEQNHNDGTASAHWREFGVTAGMARRACDNASKRGECTWLDILLEEVAEAFEETDTTKLRAELIQVAAVAQAWVEAIDRRGGQ